MSRRLLGTALILFLCSLPRIDAQEAQWWDGGMLGPPHYRISVHLTNGKSAKEDYPVTTWVDFTDNLLNLGEIGAFDIGSIRLFREPEEGSAFGEPVSYLFEQSPDYGAISRARGWLSWVVAGRWVPEEEIVYHLYFDLQQYGIKPEEVALPWEAICYSPANKVLGASLEPEAAVMDLSQSCWRGWGEGGRPDSTFAYEDGHWGRWSLAAIPGMNFLWEAQIGLLVSGQRYTLGCYVKSGEGAGPGSALKATFVSGGARRATFSKDIDLDRVPGWWREEIPLPVAPDTSIFSLTLEFVGATPDTMWIDDLFILEDPPIVSQQPCIRRPEEG